VTSSQGNSSSSRSSSAVRSRAVPKVQTIEKSSSVTPLICSLSVNTGTCIVGAAAAVDFLASLAEGPDRRSRLAAALATLHERGQRLVETLWTGLGGIDGVTLYGPPPTEPRTPTVAFTVRGRASEDVAKALADRAVFVSNGDFYATTVVRRLGQAEDGVVRAGCACYTTLDEVTRLVEGVAELAR